VPSALETAIRRTRRQIDTLEGPVRQEMADLYARAVRSLATDLELVTMQIRNAQESGVDVSPDWLRRQDRYTRLLWQAEREFARFTDDGVRLIESGRVRAIRGGAAEAWELLDAAGIERGFAANVPTYAIENAMSATYSGPVKRSLARYGEEGSQTITDTLLDGMARGRGPRAIIRDIQRALLSPANAARLESLVRTEMMRGFRNGLNEQYASMSHLISGYRWVAAKSIRTCLACLARDGEIQKTPWDQMHVNCRCINSPVPKGTNLPYQTGEEWFAGQSPERQQRMMPSRQAWDAYRDGSVKLKDFVGVHRSRTWGSAIYQRSGRDVLAAVKSIPEVRFIPASTVADARRVASELGLNVQGITPSNMGAANLINQAATQLQARGVSFPYRIALKPGPAGNKAIAQFNPKGKTPVLEVFTDTEFFRDPDGFATLMRETGVMASPDAAGLMRHEMAHGLHYKDRAYNLAQIPLNPEQKAIAMEVSRYAATNRVEFVAETYAGITGGRTFGKPVMDLYEEWRGPKP